jgi:hypothetical protein
MQINDIFTTSCYAKTKINNACLILDPRSLLQFSRALAENTSKKDSFEYAQSSKPGASYHMTPQRQSVAEIVFIYLPIPFIVI